MLEIPMEKLRQKFARWEYKFSPHLDWDIFTSWQLTTRKLVFRHVIALFEFLIHSFYWCFLSQATFSGVPYEELLDSFKYINPTTKLIPLKKLTPETLTYWKNLVSLRQYFLTLVYKILLRLQGQSMTSFRWDFLPRILRQPRTPRFPLHRALRLRPRIIVETFLN